jgi:hypothetical protein
VSIDTPGSVVPSAAEIQRFASSDRIRTRRRPRSGLERKEADMSDIGLDEHRCATTEEKIG